MTFLVMVLPCWCETAYFGHKSKEFRVAPKEVGRHFSVENVFYEAPWGVHQPLMANRGRKLRQLLRACPEIELIAEEPFFLVRDVFAAKLLQP